MVHAKPGAEMMSQHIAVAYSGGMVRLVQVSLDATQSDMDEFMELQAGDSSSPSSMGIRDGVGTGVVDDDDERAGVGVVGRLSSSSSPRVAAGRALPASRPLLLALPCQRFDYPTLDLRTP